jgi:hypothetical protein
MFGNKKEHHNFVEQNKQILMEQIDIYREKKVHNFLMEGTKIIFLGTKKNIKHQGTK